MSWTDIFPVLSEEMMAAYRSGVSEAERSRYEDWLGVERIHTAVGRGPEARNGRHVVSATLFWKHVNGADPDLPRPTRERLDGEADGTSETIFAMGVVCGNADPLQFRGDATAS